MPFTFPEFSTDFEVGTPGSGGPGIAPRNAMLDIINDALIAVGYDPVQVAEDGSDGWVAGKNAYDRMLPFVMARHDWKFRTQITDLARIGSSSFPGLSDIYEKPGDCLQLMTCWDTTAASYVQTAPQFYVREYKIRAPKFDYKLIGNHIHCVAPDGAKCLYVPWPSNDADMDPLFRETLVNMMESLLQRGVSDEPDKAKSAFQVGEMLLGEARARGDNQEPRKAAFISRSGLARRTRRA